MYPPLAGSEWVTAQNAAAPIRIVTQGLRGPITVKGQQFTSIMIHGGGGPRMMLDSDYAAVVTYIRTAWGNHASAVTSEQVARERTAFASRTTQWTAAELAPLLKSGNR